MIELKNIQVEFSRDGASATAAVDDVSWTILEGEVFGIIGSSGAGKSTHVAHHQPPAKSPRREIS